MEFLSYSNSKESSFYVLVSRGDFGEVHNSRSCLKVIWKDRSSGNESRPSVPFKSVASCKRVPQFMSIVVNKFPAVPSRVMSLPSLAVVPSKMRDLYRRSFSVLELLAVPRCKPELHSSHDYSYDQRPPFMLTSRARPWTCSDTIPS